MRKGGWRDLGLWRRPSIMFNLLVLGLMVYWVLAARAFPPEDRFVPWLAGFLALSLALVQLALEVGRRHRLASSGSEDPQGEEVQVLDVAVDRSIPGHVVAHRAVTYLAWLVGLLVGIWLVGFSTSILLFLLLGLKVQGRANWPVTVSISLIFLALMLSVFDLYAGVLWPRSLVEQTSGFSLDLVPRMRDWIF